MAKCHQILTVARYINYQQLLYKQVYNKAYYHEKLCLVPRSVHKPHLQEIIINLCWKHIIGQNQLYQHVTHN
jgi:hypothetical protein